MSITVQLNPSVAPAVACATLEAVLLSSNRILHKPRPTVTVKALNAVALDCELYFFVPDLDAATGAQNELFELVHRHCAASGLRLGPPSDSPFVVAPASVEPMRREAPRQMIDRLSILAPLTEAERASLAAKLRRRSYKTGETIIEPGSVPQTLFILGSGVLLATDKQGEEEVELFRLGPGNCFGEAGVLAGSPTRERISALTRAVVYALSKEDLAAILKERPGIATELGQILARREATGRERLREHLHRRKHQENLPEQLAERMKTLFHLE